MNFWGFSGSKILSSGVGVSWRGTIGLLTMAASKANHTSTPATPLWVEMPSPTMKRHTSRTQPFSKSDGSASSDVKTIL